MTTPLILDCDPGHDDVMALWLAAGHPALDLLAVTTVGGNVPLQHTTRNARIALAVAGVAGVPVAAGAAGPLSRELSTAEWIHGENGLLVEPRQPVQLADAIESMLRDPGLRRRLARAGRDRVVTEFDVRRNTGRLLALFHRALGVPPAVVPVVESDALPELQQDRSH